MGYRYRPLSDPGNEIRVVIIQPGLFNANLRIQFIARRLIEEGPAYEAVSYVWGSEEDSSYVTVDPERRFGLLPTTQNLLPITRNLDTALRHLRHEKEKRHMWIDALCINQRDTEEKSIQVANMGAIYKNAARTISWLGSEKDNSNNAIAILQEIAVNVEVDWNSGIMRPSASSLERLNNSKLPARTDKMTPGKQAEHWGVSSHRLPWTEQELRWVSSLLSRPYFERAWILQEIKLSTTVSFQCGFATIAETDVWDSIWCLRRKTTSGIKLSPSYLAFKRGMMQVYDVSKLRMQQVLLTYSRMRYLMQAFQCQNPRDKIYATLSLFGQQGTVDLYIRPDYSLDTENVYIDVARRNIEFTRTLDLLHTCELSTRVLNIPSWVPDWSVRTNCKEPLFKKWSACGFISANPSFDASGLVCTASGVPIAAITDVTEPKLHSRINRDILTFLQAIKPSQGGPLIQCPQRQSLTEAYCRTLIADFFQDAFEFSRPRLPTITDAINFLTTMWSKKPGLSDDKVWSHASAAYSREFSGALEGRSFIHTDGGYIGLAPTGTQIGDIVCILLGSHYPLVLRPAADPNGRRTWLVVGACYVHGVMDGEAIYQNKHAARYKAMYIDCREQDELIDGTSSALYDPDEGTYRTDPAALLEEAGVKVEEYRRYPHELIVLPESLRAAGVPVEDFVLV